MVRSSGVLFGFHKMFKCRLYCSVVKFQENCTLWQSQSHVDECVCQRAEENFPTFPRPNATCVLLGGGCLSSLDCKRADDNETFSGVGCFDQLPWPQSRKRCSPLEPTSTSSTDQSVPAQRSIAALMCLIVAFAGFF